MNKTSILLIIILLVSVFYNPFPTNQPESVIKRSLTAVVSIENIQKSRGYFRIENNLFHVLHDRGDSSEYRPVGVGSGFIISDDGYVITNAHVVEEANYLRVRLHDGTVFDNQLDKGALEVVGVDEKSDIAVLKISGRKFRPLEFANSNTVVIGESVIAIGSPFGMNHTVTVGVVSQVKRHDIFKERGFEDYIQTDASINPGNSGGPLLNKNGNVIGVSNFMIRSGLGFAISSNVALRAADQLIKFGHVHYVTLGMKTLGVIVTEITQMGPADKAGILLNDTVVSINDTKCSTPYDIDSILAKFTSNTVVKLLIVRDGVEKIFYVRAIVLN